MPCMGPDTRHIAPSTERFTAALLAAMAEQGITKPAPDSLVVRLGKCDVKWEAAVAQISAGIRELVEINTAENF